MGRKELSPQPKARPWVLQHLSIEPRDVQDSGVLLTPGKVLPRLGPQDVTGATPAWFAKSCPQKGCHSPGEAPTRGDLGLWGPGVNSPRPHASNCSILAKGCEGPDGFPISAFLGLEGTFNDNCGCLVEPLVAAGVWDFSVLTQGRREASLGLCPCAPAPWPWAGRASFLGLCHHVHEMGMLLGQSRGQSWFWHGVAHLGCTCRPGPCVRLAEAPGSGCS